MSYDHHVNADVSKTISRATNEVELYLEKRRKMFNVIKLARNKVPLQKIIEREHAIERTINLAHEYDEIGRYKRWRNETSNVPFKSNGCCSKQYDLHEKDLIFINELDSFETNLFDNLEVRKRAIGNWKRLRVLLVMMKLSGGKVRGSDKNPEDF